MRVYKTKQGVVVRKGDDLFEVEVSDWDSFINRTGLHSKLLEAIEGLKPNGGASLIDSPLAPIGNQEIWASGVTYMRSKEARMEESKKTGGDTFYDRVYDAERPELFFKATASRTVGTGQEVYIRKDSTWDVPEPELTLLISSEGTIEGYSIGNDMSSRSIEGENPLYLPQAKMYDKCAGLGPCIYVPEAPIDPETQISMEILREGNQVFEGSILISNMKRSHKELVEFLFRESEFPNGCFLMTGTGVVPSDDFTLKVGDEIRISIENIGTLINFVSKKK
ncbi:MAG: 2-dehydro-3-deoxy-D-arabinonate dehydratase [Cyclobacteriaceae bacterium]|jgi:2-dehydro-3-deoxy-D-arabinonate dehydratase